MASRSSAWARVALAERFLGQGLSALAAEQLRAAAAELDEVAGRERMQADRTQAQAAMERAMGPKGDR